MIYVMVVTFYFTVHPGLTSQIVSYHNTLDSCEKAAEEASSRNIIGPSTQGYCFASTGLENE